LNPPKRDGAASENVWGEVENVHKASVLALKECKGALAIVLLKGCISVFLKGLFYSVKVESQDWMFV
jgi:hypothetical protein